MPLKKQVWFGMKVTPEQKRRIKNLARREGISAKEAVLQAVEHALGSDRYATPQPGSFLEGQEDLVGSVGSESGPVDLASNPRHMEGFGQ